MAEQTSLTFQDLDNILINKILNSLVSSLFMLFHDNTQLHIFKTERVEMIYERIKRSGQNH